MSYFNLNTLSLAAINVPTITPKQFANKSYKSKVLLGFILFALPNLFFGITKVNGGLTGINLLIIALFQFISVTLLVYYSLRFLNKDFPDIGWKFEHWKKDYGVGGKAMADAIVELSTDPELRCRLGATGKRRCADEFQYQTMTVKLRDLYVEVLERHTAV